MTYNVTKEMVDEAMKVVDLPDVSDIRLLAVLLARKDIELSPFYRNESGCHYEAKVETGDGFHAVILFSPQALTAVAEAYPELHVIARGHRTPDLSEK